MLKYKESAILVGIRDRHKKLSEVQNSLEELKRLAETAGAGVAGMSIQNINHYNPAYLIGQGKAQELADNVKKDNLQSVIFDNDLTPAQQRNLEELVGAKIVDRTKLILDIFAQRAHTAEGKLQVELAQMSYLLPRLTGKGVALAQQVGGVGSMGATRGPGERKLEYDRRRIRDHIAALHKEISKLKEYRSLQRQKRQDIPLPIIALVGYTNAGKSTLLNTMTGADVFVEDKLFATLDPTTRRLTLPSRQKVLFTDTVGFIRKLPHQLVAAFRATLEEVVEADLLLHVIDASHPEYEQQIVTVNEVLSELGLQDKPRILVFNKIDLVKNQASSQRLKRNHPEGIFISAAKKTHLDALYQQIMAFLAKDLVEKSFVIPYEKYKLVGHLLASGNILEKEYLPGSVAIKALVDKKTYNVIKKYSRAGKV
ncbi:MAG: GTPase HflX [bacterium]|nr:GTPase HflX [bacterium]MDD5354084.1 GTPase HflX [bacterium]MDD5757403.1 GTPase HflX [bacterium]